MTFQRNTFKRGLAAASIVAAMTAWGAAEAATSYSANAAGTLTFNLSQPEDQGLAQLSDLTVSWQGTESIIEDSFGGGVTGNSASAFGNSEVSGSSSFLPTGPSVSFSVNASATGSADATVFGTKADSFVDTLAGLAITFTNGGTTGYTIFGDLSYSTSADASIDRAVDEYAEADAFLLLEGEGSGDLLSFSGDTIDFFLAAGATETIYFEAYANGLSESFAPVPVPAALPLLASALLGGGLFARRRG